MAPASFLKHLAEFMRQNWVSNRIFQGAYEDPDRHAHGAKRRGAQAENRASEIPIFARGPEGFAPLARAEPLYDRREPHRRREVSRCCLAAATVPPSQWEGE